MQPVASEGTRLRPRRGVALLEAIVATAILATAGVALFGLTADSVRVVQRARESESELRDANAFFEAVSLWSHGDLDLRLGRREQGQWQLQIDRPIVTLCVVTLSDTTGERILLQTSLFRPDSAHAAR